MAPGERASGLSTPVFIGDEVSAAGFRLAGLQIRTPAADAELQTLEQAAREAPLVLVSAGIAQRIPTEALDRLLAAIEPQVIIVPDVHGDAPMPALTARIRRQLGVLE